VARALEFEQPALAITDHGNVHAAWTFQETAHKQGLKPILGMEAYVAPGDRRIRARPAGGGKAYYHLVVLARDITGYRNLIKLSSLGYAEGFYTRPRVDRELLARYSEGLIVSSACMAGEVATHLLNDRYDDAREAASWYAELFKDRYYLEVQAHDSPGQARLNDEIFRLAADLGLPVVATNDAHFLRADDHDAHDVLLCIGLGRDRSDTDRMKYDGGLYFKSADEIRERFPGHPEVLEHSLAIADQVDIRFEKKTFVPSFPLPEGVSDEQALLVRLATDGAKTHYGDPLPAHVQERLDYELGVIGGTGYAGYFLIVADFIRAARERDIPVGPGRGSAAGSLVAYALGITTVDPLEYDLLFERFLNPERVEMPDIDIDFCFERRGEVIEYVREKYGREAVGQIVTFGTMKSRAAIKDVGRTLGFTPAETDGLAKLVPNAPNNSLTVREAVTKVPEVKKLYRDDPRYTRLLDYAIALEGLSRHTGVHAAGVVIAPGPLDEYVPTCTQASKGAGAGSDESVVVTQYDMTSLAKAGMLKIDFLGLTTLTVIDKTLKSIRSRTGSAPDLDAVSLDEPETYRMLRSGRTVGVFQFESALATDMLRGMRCDRFDDLVASNALMRPGPLDAGMHRVYQRRKRGEEPVTYALPELEPILGNTYGVITYQEQLMRIAQALAGISLAEADVLRKAVGKKNAELIRQELGKFETKAVARGYDAQVIADIAGQIETFGRYGFNKSHSVAYSVLSFQTAWLKCHHPADFMAALLSSSIGDTDNVVKYISEARELDIEVLAPDVNESGYQFTVVGDKRIRFGLGAIRNVGHGAIASILEAREAGPFTALLDLCERVDLRLCNKRVFEALIHAGALDDLGANRAQLLAILDTTLQEASLTQNDRVMGQGSLFGDADGAAGASSHTPLALPNVPPLPASERLAREKEALGFYISGHPLEPYRRECELFATHTVSQLGTWQEEGLAIGAVVTAIRTQMSKRSGATFARLTVEDFSGSSEALAFPEAWTVLQDKVRTDVPLLIRGSYSRRDRDADNPTFIIETVQRFEELRVAGHVTVAIELGGRPREDNGNGAPGNEHIDDGMDVAAMLLPDVMRDVRAVAEAHPGAAPLEVRWSDGNGTQARWRSRSITMSATNAALKELRALLGDERVRLVRGS
jgi:DNA polymerase-3 subunit alpha